jgi:hypothetical protein
MIVWSYCHMAVLPDVPVPRGKSGDPNLGVGKKLLCMAWARDAEGRLRSAPEACSSGMWRSWPRAVRPTADRRPVRRWRPGRSPQGGREWLFTGLLPAYRRLLESRRLICNSTKGKQTVVCKGGHLSPKALYLALGWKLRRFWPMKILYRALA